MDAPVVLGVSGQMHVVSVGNHQILSGWPLRKRHGKQQVVVVDAPVAVAIEGREVFDQFDPAVAEHAEIELGVHALDLPAKLPLMRASHEREARRRTATASASCPAAL